ncbi:MAG: peptidylprolyl isomerase [Patescibacteria group bacterium]
MGKKSQLRREKKEQFAKERVAYRRQMEFANTPWLLFWRRVDFWIYSVCLALVITFPFVMRDSLVIGDQATIHTSKGDIEVSFYPKETPKAVENFTGLAKNGYYNNTIWHRVIKGFMIQGGDPGGTGTGGESLFGGPFDDEINAYGLGMATADITKLEEKGYRYNQTITTHPVQVGSLAMANAGPNTNGSQFFIVTEQDQPHLNGQHTVFGRVTKGLEIAKAISEVPIDSNDKPTEDVKILSVDLK